MHSYIVFFRISNSIYSIKIQTIILVLSRGHIFDSFSNISSNVSFWYKLENTDKSFLFVLLQLSFYNSPSVFFFFLPSVYQCINQTQLEL